MERNIANIQESVNMGILYNLQLSSEIQPDN